MTQPIIDDIQDESPEPEAIRKMLVSSMPEQLKLGIAMGKDSGMRLGEMLQIQFEDIHLNEDPIRISIRREHTKVTNKRHGRDVFLGPESTELLKEWIKKHENHYG